MPRIQTFNDEGDPVERYAVPACCDLLEDEADESLRHFERACTLILEWREAAFTGPLPVVDPTPLWPVGLASELDEIARRLDNLPRAM